MSETTVSGGGSAYLEIGAQPDSAEPVPELTERLLSLASRLEGTVPASEVRDFMAYFDTLEKPLGFELVESVWYELRLRQGQRLGDDRSIIDWVIDRTLGFDCYATELPLRAERHEREEMHRGDLLWIGLHVQTPYTKIRDMLHVIKPSETDVVYDLGSGYSRLPLYAGLTTLAQTVGVELVTERVQAAQAVVDRLELGNVQIIEGSMLDQDLSDGTIFYMWQPSTPETINKVLDQLRDVAADHPIRLVLRGGQGRAEDHSRRHDDWLQAKDMEPSTSETVDLHLYQSVLTA